MAMNTQPRPTCMYNNDGYHFPEAAATYPSYPLAFIQTKCTNMLNIIQTFNNNRLYMYLTQTDSDHDQLQDLWLIRVIHTLCVVGFTVEI